MPRMRRPGTGREHLALTEIARESDPVPREFRNVHYFESDVPKMEHAQVIADLPDHLVLKTLRGWIMWVPVTDAIHAMRSE
jgi:hypothetical protein